MDKSITCRVCGSSIHSVKVHLAKEHGPTSHIPYTLEMYTAAFPSEPMLSQAAIEQIERNRQGGVAPLKSKPGSQASFSSTFGLGDMKGAKRADGSEIMISISSVEGNEHLIPSYKANYVYDLDVLKTITAAFEVNLPVYLYGHSGIGKTSLLKQFCAATMRRLKRFQHSVNTQESDILGQWVVSKHQVSDNVVSITEFQLGVLPTCMLNGWTFLADEFDRTPPSVTSVYNAILEGEGEPLTIPDAPPEYRIIKPHPEFRFVATGNTNGSGDESGLYQATMQQDAATIERFAVSIRLDYMPPVQEALILRSSARVSQSEADQLVKFAKEVREKFPKDISLTIGPRVLIRSAQIGMLRASFTKGIEVAFANRLPSAERRAVLEVAQRFFGSDAK